jgi:hypothetical protein
MDRFNKLAIKKLVSPILNSESMVFITNTYIFFFNCLNKKKFVDPDEKMKKRITTIWPQIFEKTYLWDYRNNLAELSFAFLKLVLICKSIYLICSDLDICELAMLGMNGSGTCTSPCLSRAAWVSLSEGHHHPWSEAWAGWHSPRIETKTRTPNAPLSWRLRG